MENNEDNICDSHLLEDDVYFNNPSFGLNTILLNAIKRNGFSRPTIVQNQSIPIILEGKDVLVRARTGSGKTLAYVIPILQKILLLNLSTNMIRVVILVPTNELVHQVYNAIQSLLKYIDTITVCELIGDDKKVEITKLKEKPTILISTPKKLVDHMKSGNIDLKGQEEVSTLVIDEADLVLSYGYESDVKYLIQCLPPNCQSILMSATLSEDILKLKKLLLHNPIVLKLQEDNQKSLIQLYMDIVEEDKFLLLFSLIKLNIIKGKVLFFVNSIEKAYRFKLFLEQFSIPCAVLNSELPFNSRMNILDQYNNGTFQYLIATDESLSDDIIATENNNNENEEGEGEEGGEEEGVEEEEVEEEEGGEEEGEENENGEEEEEEEEEDEEPEEEEEEESELDEQLEDIPKIVKKDKKNKKTDIEYGVSRGFDFKSILIFIFRC